MTRRKMPKAPTTIQVIRDCIAKERESLISAERKRIVEWVRSLSPTPQAEWTRDYIARGIEQGDYNFRGGM